MSNVMLLDALRFMEALVLTIGVVLLCSLAVGVAGRDFHIIFLRIRRRVRLWTGAIRRAGNE